MLFLLATISVNVYPATTACFLTISLQISDFALPVPDAMLTGDYSVGKLSAIDLPTRPTQPSIRPL